MRAVWVDEGNVPNWDKLAKHGITWVYVSARDHRAKKSLEDTFAKGFKGGVYTAWNWYPNLSGAEYAEKTHALLSALWPSAKPGFPKVQLNDETHDPERILGMLRRWRQLRPATETSWTMEGMQGGWMSPVFAKTVTDLKIRVVPQAYYGTMAPGQVYDTLAVARDLTKRGIPDRLVSPFYDASQMPAGWDGFAFTQGRLP